MTNTTDSCAGAPRLRIGLSLITISALPDWSTGPKGSLPEQLSALRAAGIEAAQAHSPELIHAIQKAGLIATALARVDKPEEARGVARRGKEWGCDCTTLHVGSGFESDIEAMRLMEVIAEAANVESHPLFVETHRATATQDMKRTLDLVERVPELRFNGDFSHWYTGAEMTYGGFDAKLARLQPIFERTRFLHGRVSAPGCIQIPIRGGDQHAQVAAFEQFWTRSFRGFLATAGRGEVMGFYPELLPASYHYARLIPRADGSWTEESDRWEEALALIDIARSCWVQATSVGNAT